MKYIHLKCLREWIRKRTNNKKNKIVIDFPVKTISCELCKSTYPLAIHFNGKIHEIIKLNVPSCPYMVVESDSKDISFISFQSSKNVLIVILLIASLGSSRRF